jgi:type II secretory pathway pseudopilin PulG
MPRQKVEAMISRLIRQSNKPALENRGQQGFALVEALVSLAILSITVMALVAGLSTAVLGTNLSQTTFVAESLAQSQVEHTLAQPYAEAPTTYPTIPSVPSGFNVFVSALPLVGGSEGIQKIVITVYHQEVMITTLESVKIQ